MNEQISERAPMGEEVKLEKTFSERHRLMIKVVLIFLLTLILIIPVSMITSTITEREQNADSAIAEVQSKWSNEQTITGPVLIIPYYNGNTPAKIEHKYILPEELNIDGKVNTELLKRGIYQVVVYNSPLTISGKFVLPNEFRQMKPEKIVTDNLLLSIGLSDLRGINDLVKVDWDGEQIQLDPGMPNGLFDNGLSAKIKIESLTKEKNSIRFSIVLQLKGSKSLKFTPVGKTTTVNLSSNCTTPSFTGMFLPDSREVNEDGFKSDWKVLYLNRNYGQLIESSNLPYIPIEKSAFGVDLRIPVHEYQQSMRSVKYAFLIIILTFVISFFVEVKQKKNIHPLQYLLIGSALCLFYSLLLSLSEHIGFMPAYFTAAIMTVLLLVFYLIGLLKMKKTAITISALLSLLYVYIFVLIQMETYALLAGSIGLFIILAVIMYYSQKIKW